MRGAGTLNLTSTTNSGAIYQGSTQATADVGVASNYLGKIIGQNGGTVNRS